MWVFKRNLGWFQEKTRQRTMKTRIRNIVAVLTAIVGLFLTPNIAFAGDAPAVGETISTAVVQTETVNHGGVTLMSPPPEVDIRVVPILAPPQNMVGFWPVAVKAVNDTINSTWTTDSGYKLCRGKISATNVVYSKTGETLWLVVQQLIDVRSVDGKDTISLSEIKVTAESVPSALNRTYQVGNNGYGEAAIGIREDGSLVTSGSPSQKVARVVFVVQMPLFVDDPAVVRAWVLSQENFTINYTVKYGTSAYVGRATVSILGYGNYRPELVRNASGTSFTVEGGDPNRSYDILSASEAKGPYVETGLPPVYSGDIWSFINNQQMQFFRLEAAGW